MKDSNFGKIPARKIKKYHCDDFIRTLTNGTIVYSYVCQIKCIVSQAFWLCLWQGNYELELYAEGKNQRGQVQEIPQLSGSFYSLWHWLKAGRTACLKMEQGRFWNEIFKIYDFDFCEQRAEVMLAWPWRLPQEPAAFGWWVAVNKWKLCLHNVLKRIDGNSKKCCQ